MAAVEGFTPLELDALRELMNIGFGQAALALSEVMDLRVILNVPRVSVVQSDSLVDFIDREVAAPASYAVVEQPYYGNLSGLSFFLLPSGEEDKLREILGLAKREAGMDFEARSVEDEALIEIGNIVIGACVGKIASVLGDQVSFQPPHVSAVLRDPDVLARRLGEEADLALVFKTVFHFEREDLSGFLFLIASASSMAWIRKAVDLYIEGLG